MIYLDNAATSYPKPETVYGAMSEFGRTAAANPGRGAHRMGIEAGRMVAAVRRGLADLFGGTDPDRMIFTFNATDGINMAVKGVLDPGDHVVTTCLEHNSLARPLQRMAAEGAITLTAIEPREDGRVDPGDVEAAMTDRTRLVALAHASNVLGVVQPIRGIGEVARSRGALFLVDAAQTAGVLPIDVEADRIDLLAFSGHKGLLGPTGTGGLYVGTRASVRAWREGGTGGDSTSPVQPAELPHHLEAGTLNVVGIAGLAEGLRYIGQRGQGRIAAHEVALAARLWAGLEQIPRIELYGQRPGATEARTGIVSLNVEGVPPVEVEAMLDASAGIVVRAGLHCAPGAHRFAGTSPEGTVRVSPGPFSEPAHIDAILEALSAIAA